MLVAYFSITGNVKQFVQQLGVDSVEITPDNPFLTVKEDYIVIAPTYDVEMTEPINAFIEFENNFRYLRGIVGSGNYNFNDLYIFTAKDLAKQYKVPLLHDFEYFGTGRDVKIVREELDKREITNIAN